MNKGMTISDAAHRWVSEMNMYPHSMIDRLMSVGINEWTEVTKPSKYNTVYIFDQNVTGEIVEVIDEDDEKLYKIAGYDGNDYTLDEDNFEIERDSLLPAWGWLFSFRDNADDYWLSDLDGLEVMSECGFRIYEHEEWGYFFGIDGAGYDFYSEHWIPLYKKRGLQWHDPEADER